MEISGFVDLQVNGYGGVNFSDAALTLEQVTSVACALYARGTLAFCPTVITSDLDVYRGALPVLAQAILAQQGGLAPRQSLLLGIHLEGPFISPVDGAVGVHPREFVQLPSTAFLDQLDSLAQGQIALLTLAPEQPGALEVIRSAVQKGIAVSIGHSLADAAQVRAAVLAGARLSTHLGNGLPNQIHRHHNPLWPQLAAPELSAMLITDGHHLPDEMIMAMLAAKGVERALVTSDAAPAAGCPPGEYSYFGSRVLLEPSGRLRSLDRATLAGSSAAMIDCMNTLARLGGWREADLWRLGRDNPLAMLGLSANHLPAGLVCFQDSRFQIV
jgi:N-acetylglucosamine-6-phosphate deacetylase